MRRFDDGTFDDQRNRHSTKLNHSPDITLQLLWRIDDVFIVARRVNTVLFLIKEPSLIEEPPLF